MMSGCVADAFGDQELSGGTGRRYPFGEIDCAADIIAFTVKDGAAVRADVQRGELWLGVDEAIHREAKGDGVGGLGERQHELITDLLEDSSSVSCCAAAHSGAEPAQYFSCRVIAHGRGQWGKAGQIDEEDHGLFLARCGRRRRGRLGEMAQQVFPIGALIGPPVKIHQGRFDEVEQWFAD